MLKNQHTQKNSFIISLWLNHSGSVYRGHFQSTALTPLLPAPLLFLLEVAPSILQNALRLASRLLQLLHFTCWLVGRSTPSHALFFRINLSLSHLCSGEPDKCSQHPMVRAKALTDVTVWLSRTLGWELWVCCNVTLVAVTHSGSYQINKMLFLSRLKCSYMQTLQNTFIQ